MSPDETPPPNRDVASENAPGADPGRVPAGTLSEAEIIDTRQGMFGVSGSGDTSGYGGLIRTITMPPPSERPYGGAFDEIADALDAALETTGEASQAVEKVVVDRGEITFHVRREHIVSVCQALRDHPDLRFELCSGVSGVHYPHDEGRELHSVYHLLSITHNRRIRLETTCPDADPHIPSVVSVYPTADWHERETWDFFGIIFDGHPALTRIQMPDDWPGHPQRKDYPLGGIPSVVSVYPTADWHERETWDFFGIQFDGHPSLTRIEMPDDWPGHPQRKDYPLGGIPVEYKGASIPPPDTRRSYS